MLGGGKSNCQRARARPPLLPPPASSLRWWAAPGICHLSLTSHRLLPWARRYRTLAEVTGALLVKAARLKGLHMMAETSGRDIAMFRYIEHFFPDDKYQKLVVHFDVSDIRHAERSVDARMKKEMAKVRRLASRASRDSMPASYSLLLRPAPVVS